MSDHDVWEDIAQSIHFEHVNSKISAIEDAPWRRAGFSRPYHIIFHILNGGLTMALNRGRETLILGTGDCVYVRAGTWRQDGPVHDHRGATLRFSSFHCPIFNQIDLLSFFEIPPRVTGSTAEILKDQSERLANLSIDRETEAALRCVETQATGLEMLSTLLKTSTSKANLNAFAAGAERFADVFNFISTHYHRPISLREMAEMACLSVSAFHRSFKATTGASPASFLRDRRLEEAKRLLLATDSSLADIAASLGYSDQFAFSKSFKKHCGQNPRSYRANARRKGADV